MPPPADFLDPRKLFDHRGQVLPLEQMDEDTRAAIASVEVDAVGTKKVKLWDKRAALDSLARCLGMFKDSMRVQVDPLKELLDYVNSKGGGLKPVP
jgi:phage terminase small subunit